MRSWRAAVMVGAFVASCGSTPGISGGSQFLGRCPAPTSGLDGQKPTGAACMYSDECLAVCCNCKNNAKSYLAVSCLKGKCDDAETACAEVRKHSGFCE